VLSREYAIGRGRGISPGAAYRRASEFPDPGGIAGRSGPGRPTELAEALRDAERPRVYPLVSGIRVGSDGTTWIEEYHGDSGRTYHAIDPEGNSLGRTTAPQNQRLAAAQQRRIWVVEKDAFGVESVVRYRVSW